ncbi:MAG: signal peptidase II [Bacillota bacterium]
MLIFILIILLLDQVTKLIIVNNFTLHQSVPIIKDIFHLTYVRNFGAAFGLFVDQRWFFIIITTIIVGILLYFYKEAEQEGLILQSALVLGLSGSLGNLIDRIRLGYVIDFLDFRIWPVFNLADIAIVVGVSLFFYWAIILDGLE